MSSPGQAIADAPTVGLLDYSILNCNLDEIKFDSKCLVNTINQYSYVAAQKDNDFRKALIESDILLADGIGIVAALKMLKGKKVKKIAGADLHQYLLEKLNKEGGRCFYLGSKQSTLDAIRERLHREYPNIKSGFYSPPFKPQFTDAENAEMVQIVNAFKPDVLFVGMTAPKQEKWSYQHKDQLDTHIICPIGAVFDFYAETIKRPSKFWIGLGLEWFIRLVKEPKRMSKRYLYYGPVFIWELLKIKLSRKMSS
ncbi:MAG: WecB/TagA/CpsF family glycosyltransferase [Bacteroidetes bacterium]|nr:WecB/TagA/CpsF family glycosyltransferase [Bacteroidota bacterium]